MRSIGDDGRQVILFFFFLKKKKRKEKADLSFTATVLRTEHRGQNNLPCRIKGTLVLGQLCWIHLSTQPD